MSENLPVTYKVEIEQLRQAEFVSAAGRFDDAAGLILDASVSRDTLASEGADTELLVLSATEYNESLHYFLGRLTGEGFDDAAEWFVGKRLRESSDSYEVAGLHYWAAVQEAHKGNLVAATEQVRYSIDVAEAIGSPWLVAQHQNLLSRIYEDMGDEDKAIQVIAGALDSIERGSNSELYFPENYKLNAMYGTQYRLRFFLGQRLFFGREHEVRNFCNEVLTASPDPARRGLLHHWLGQASMLHRKTIGKSGRYWDATEVTIHLKAAEDYFVAANEPVYAGMVVIDQGECGDMPRALERAEVHLEAAIQQHEATESTGLAMEINNLVEQFQQARLRTFVSPN